jgi:hypothetical protein
VIAMVEIVIADLARLERREERLVSRTDARLSL